MSTRSVAEPFLMTPYSLLRIPEYGRFFDGASIGYVYRILRTKIRRHGVASLKFQSETGWLTEVAKLYDKGWLASYTTLEDLAEETGYGVRTLRNHLTKLTELKLIQVRDFGSGTLVVMGKRLTLTTPNGYKVGDSHEGYFLDEWESWAARNELEFRKMLLEELAPPAKREAMLGKILHEAGKNFARIEDEEINSSSRSERTDLEVPEPPRIDKIRIDVKDTDPPTGESGLIETSNRFSKLIRSATSFSEGVDFARQAVAEGVPLAVTNAALLSLLDTPRFPKYPRLSAAVLEYKPGAKAPHSELGKLWAALHEDTTGNVATSTRKFYTEVVGAYKNSLLKEFPEEQCVWTLKHVLDTNPRTTEFIAVAGRNLITVVRQLSKEYQVVREAVLRSKVEDEAERLRAIKENEAREATRRRVEEGAEGDISPYSRYLFEESKRLAERKRKFKDIMRGVNVPTEE